MNKPHLYHIAVILQSLEQAKALVEQSFAAELPMLTLHMPQQDFDTLAKWWADLIAWPFLKSEQIRVAVHGKWYELPEQIVEKIKKAVNDTKEFDKHFLNLCLNYDGQEEIVDACKLMALQVKLGRLSPEGITKEALKENLYSSGILPPSVIISPTEQLNGFLLWDAAKARIVVGEPEKVLKQLLS